MRSSRYAQVFILLVAASLQASVVWQDPATPLAGKLASTAVTFLALAVERTKVREVEQVVVAACVAGGTVMTVVLAHLSASSTTATVLSVALATFAQVRGVLGTQLARGALPARELGPLVEEPPTETPGAAGKTP